MTKNEMTAKERVQVIKELLEELMNKGYSLEEAKQIVYKSNEDK